MSYHSQNLTPDASRTRPVPVTVAALVLVLMATVGLAHAAAGLVTLGGTVDRYRAAVPTADRAAVDATVGVVRGLAIVATVLAVAAVVLLVLLAVGLLRGGRAFRLATWVVCGLGLLCGYGSVAMVVAQRVGSLSLRTDVEVVAAVTDAYPNWWVGLGTSLSVGQTLGYLLVAGLLALPASNAYFARRAPVERPSALAGPLMPR